MPYVAALLAWSLLHLTWQGGVLLGAALLARRATRGRSPLVRHAVAAALLAVAAASPVLTALATHAALHHAATVAGATPGDSLGAPLGAGEATVAALFDAWYPALRWTLAAWASGALLLGVRLLGGARRLAVARWGDPSATTERRAVERRLATLAARLDVSPPPALRWSPTGAAPMVVGVRRPTLVLPTSIVGALAADELDAVLLHELAHVRRRDVAANLAQCAVEAALWFHPAVWLLSDALRAEREQCCDLLAVRASGAPFALARALARALVRLHEVAAPAPALAVAWGGGALTRRVEALVAMRGAPAATRPRCVGPLAAALAAALAACVVVAPALLARDSETLLVTGTTARAVPGRVTTFQAHDPAGPFTLRLVNGRVASLRLAGARVSPRRLRQVRDSVQLLGPTGRGVVLSLQVDAASGRIAWLPRPAAGRHAR